MVRFILIAIFFLIMLIGNVHAITKVGNGNDGDDLQSYEEIVEGPILISKYKTLELLKKLNVNSVPHLSNLLPEVRNSKLLMAKKNLSKEKIKEMGGYEGEKQIYARTFPKENASTRFFPIAKKLNESQLIALHIHEALHRALPSRIRKNEESVERITEAIVDPSSSNDLITKIVSNEMNGNAKVVGDKEESYENVSFDKYDKSVVEKSKLNNPSTIGFEQSFLFNDGVKSNNTVNGITKINSYLYPFGKNRKVFGLGLDLNILQMENDTYLGPLGISGRGLVFTKRGFDVELFGKANINTISDSEFTDSYLGRDTFTAGVGIRYETSNFYVQNDLGYTLKSDTEQGVGPTIINYSFGDIISTKLKLGKSIKNWNLGLLTEVYLMNESIEKDDSGYFDRQDNLRLVTLGPEVSYDFDSVQVFGKFRYKLDSTDNVSLEKLGNITSFGAGDGSLSLGLKYKF